jgi:hypothetical protein
MHKVRYRLNDPNLRPRRTKLEIPGWAGQSDRRVDGSHEHAWHCVPFSEAATAGIELFYPYDHELRVSTREGALMFDGDLGEPPGPGLDWPPFRSFGREYYTYQILIDLKVEDGYAIKTETHPRFYTDRTGTVPIAVPAQLRHWWPMMNFCVFKAPIEGQTHIFRPGEPFMQITVVPADDKIDLMDMPPEEAAEREMQARRIHASRDTIGLDSRWTSDTNTVFDGTYRRILGAFKRSR